MASKIEDHGPEDTRRLAVTLPSVQLDKIRKYQVIEGIAKEGNHKNSQIRSQNNEICRKTYLLHILGEMLNWEFLPVKGKRPIDLDGTFLKDWTNKKFSIKECLSAKGATGIGVKTGLHLLCLDFDGESAFDIASEAGIDWPLNTGFEIHRDAAPFNLKQLFAPTPKQLALLPNGEFQGKVKGKDGEALEVFLTHKRQIVIFGEHPDGGNYFWPPNNQPEILKPLTAPSDATWKFVLEVANQKPTVTTKRNSPSCNGEWVAARPCPVCGRDKDDDCRTNRAGDVILCHRGNTFHPPSMELGEIISGTKWAYCGSGEDCIGTFSKFIIHRPTTIQELRRQLAEKANARN